MTIHTHLSGYPRIGEKRELKKATEAYWKGGLSLQALEEAGRALRLENWRKQSAAGIDLVACNDFSFYDQMLDMTCLLGNVPPRFSWQGGQVGPDVMFRMARGGKAPGHDHGCCGSDTFACEMTKWFDTNYHYIVPEFRTDTVFKLSGSKVFEEFEEAKAAGFQAKPVLIGPLTYLSLGKAREAGFDAFRLLGKLIEVYEEILEKLAARGAEWVQLDEPVLAMDIPAGRLEGLHEVYVRLAKAAGPCRLVVAAGFGPLRENLPAFLNLPVAALHFDAVRGAGELDGFLAQFPKDKILSLGVVDGRNVWKNELQASLATLEKARAVIGAERLWVAPSCSLIHSPVTLRHETSLDPELQDWLAFADEKLAEVVVLSRVLRGMEDAGVLEENRRSMERRRQSARIHNPAVKARLAAVRAEDGERTSPFSERRIRQRAVLKLPPFPTTTIGSFPQTAEVRSARARWRKGELSGAAYEAFLEEETARCLKFQEEAGLDMLVHGEFERTDMVEYFGEMLEGFAFTAHGWVQSYGTRCVKPPLIFGDVSRPEPMTVRWSSYARSLTKRPVKGMLTGPVTILQWSFVRDDQPRSVTATQIALAIRDEVLDLEKAGIAAIQIDEPALREGLPLRRAEWPLYLDWAARAFKLSAGGVRAETQIHTHMCYCEFNDIMEAIAALDADVITLEASRSGMELLEAFEDFRYPNEIGPGVYDIHSPRVPSVDEMERLMEKAAAFLPAENLWVNPDCGLKTRGWEETRTALTNMVAAARRLRRAVPNRPRP